MNRIRLLLVCGLLAMLLLQTQVVIPQAAQADEPKRAVSIVLIGDSYTAGNGAGDYFGGFNNIGSFRSHRNWGQVYANWLNNQGVSATVENLAWSGSTSADVLREQINEIPSSADLVMLTIGGNDVDFGGVVTNCFALGARSPAGCRDRVDHARRNLDKVVANTKDILEALERRLSPEAQVILVGYPHLSLDTYYGIGKCDRWDWGNVTCAELSDLYEPLNHLRELNDRLDDQRSKLVAEWNNSSLLEVAYIDVVSTHFKGHEPQPESYAGRNEYRWINEFFETDGRRGLDGKTESRFSADWSNWYHPNITGHEEVAEVLKEVVGVPRSSRLVTGTNEAIDIVFAIDTTGSMSDDIDSVRRNVSSIVSHIESSSSSARFALVSYQDHPVQGGGSSDYPSRLEQGFTEDGAVLRAKLDALTLGDGGDWEESVYSGVTEGLNLPWRNGVRKILIALGDAPAKDPEPVTGLTAAQVAQHAFEIDPVEVYGIDTGGLAEGGFSELVEATGGKIFNTWDSEDVPGLIMEAIDSALEKPFAWIQGPYVVKVGDLQILDAGASYAVQGDIVKYEWDFDGDGEYDTETTEPMTEHVYTEIFDGFVGVRVTDSNDLSSVGSTTISVTRDGDTIPDAEDNCPDDINWDQADTDGDGVGDACDDTPGWPTEDQEGVFVLEEGDGQPPLQPSPAPSSSPSESAVPPPATSTPTPTPSASRSPGATPTGSMPAVRPGLPKTGDTGWSITLFQTSVGVESTPRCLPEPSCA